MKSLAFLSLLLVSVVVADAPTSSVSPLIPSDVSSDCEAFLKTLDADPQLQTCISALTNATSAFTANSTPSSADITKAVSSICSSGSSTACSSASIRSQLTTFYSKCQPELSSETTVKTLYDYLYTLGPLQQALCSTDGNGNSCMSSIFTASYSGSSTLTGLLSTAKQYLTTTVAFPKRATSSASTFSAINSTTVANTNLLFMFISPSSPTSLLCSTCAQTIMKAYTSMELALPYSTGITQSVLLSQQKPLWTAMTDNCNQGAIANAGAAPSSSTSPELGGSISGARSTAKASPGVLGLAAAFGMLVAL